MSSLDDVVQSDVGFASLRLPMLECELGTDETDDGTSSCATLDTKSSFVDQGKAETEENM